MSSDNSKRGGKGYGSQKTSEGASSSSGVKRNSADQDVNMETTDPDEFYKTGISYAKKMGIEPPKSTGEFNGAGPGVTLDDDPAYKCSKCQQGFQFYGCLANTYGADAKVFHRYEASAVTATIGEAEGKAFKSVGTGADGNQLVFNETC